ncbi:NAD(+) diphosphatase [Alcanivorax quisquiliarum]|uniref:NAD-capped RNA hydrolase NudC n=1 Tax=Alcanivorax quisquiliarum TaxID=2933565 RepID=A0ABT0E3V4_9GAMM|nr:NAD(+) diphosphatase [Alcanivorax quisquiliarum]
MPTFQSLQSEFELLASPPARLEGEAIWFAFHDGQMMVSDDPALPLLPQAEDARWLGLDGLPTHYLGRLRGQHCFAVSLDSPERLLPGYHLAALRQLLGQTDEVTFAMAGRASQVVTWHRNHQFCSRCGAPAHGHAHDRAMTCSQCEYTAYPRISPCIIALVTRGDEALLARAARFPARFFSCLAGFIEAGESAEQAVHREVFEETGLKLGTLHYYASQSWPFPHALMLGYHADYAGGEIQVDGEEIVEAHWWHYTDLPPIPPTGSIARALIESWVQRRRALAEGGV